MPDINPMTAIAAYVRNTPITETFGDATVSFTSAQDDVVLLTRTVGTVVTKFNVTSIFDGCLVILPALDTGYSPDGLVVKPVVFTLPTVPLLRLLGQFMATLAWTPIAVKIPSNTDVQMKLFMDKPEPELVTIAKKLDLEAVKAASLAALKAAVG